mmetsp:Transcript_25123/g.58851  ORF Transcript_25123/g.58851 Transcript_25123/m.58851 type:complete len:515 (-) Transcript_25123:124-1668(-)
MGKRPNETNEERVARKARKKARKEEKLGNTIEEKKKDKKEKKDKKKKKEKEKLKHQKSDSKCSSSSSTVTEDVKKTLDAKDGLVSWNSFTETPFEEPIQKALLNAGFEKPSPIQAKAWPVAISGKDVVAVAKTGSGKTLGFLLPIFHRISTQSFPVGARENIERHSGTFTPSPLALVVSPTRELAIQIHGECVKFGIPMGITSICLYGGTSASAQIKEMRNASPQIVVATPGRLCDLLDRKPACLTLKRCHFVVLDEADRMLDMGFEPQLKQITAALPVKGSRQTLFFTATWPKAVRKVASKFMRGEQDTVEIFLGEGIAEGELVANKSVKQTFVEAQDDVKDEKLYNILCKLDEKASVVIFANTKRRVDYVAKLFWQEGFSTCAVHGDKQQHERDAALRKFVSKECSMLVATDVAARGLDIKGVTHVINFDMARDCDSYIHRIGRTGRAGEVGEAITFWNPDYDKPCSPALVKIAKDAGQVVPTFLQEYEKGKASKQWKVTDAAKAKSVLIST